MGAPLIENASRRDFLKAGAGLSLAVLLPAGEAGAQAAPLAPNAFVRVGADNTVTVIAKHLEMGQGTWTGLATLVAEELDAAWEQVRVEGAPADAKRYNNLFWGPAQGTGGSSAIANSFEQLRQAGATARAMLVSAAAQRWQVPEGELTARGGVVYHGASGRKASYGELAEAAAALPVPAQVRLKTPEEFVLIGKRIPRKDSRDKTTGKARFTQDVQLPGMLTAVVAHPPRFGAVPAKFDASATRKIKGVVDVVQLPAGVAVIAKDFWAARKGREALKVEWDESRAYRGSSADILASYRTLAESEGKPARKDGDAPGALKSAPKVFEAGFDFPYLAHAAMEPMNCVMRLDGERCEVWNGEQLQTGDQYMVAATLGLKPENVALNMLYAGGSFGRRANPAADYLVECAQILKATGGKYPLKLVWTREDDMRAGYYRPLYHHRLQATLDDKGMPLAWQQRIVGQSILTGTPFEGMLVKDGVDATSVEGAANLPYHVPNLRVELHTTNADVRVPVLWWRSVGSTHTAFATEVFLDELAHAAGKDPVAYRLALLDKHPRHAAVLKLAADKAGWGTPLAPGEGKRARGVALHESFDTVVAQVVELSVAPDKSWKLERVVCAVDCGLAINPDIVKAQMEGSIGFALSAALHGAITLKDGVVEQSNFHDYAPLRIHEMPRVEVHIQPSTNRPTGVGEPGVPPLAPAVANALFAATGQRLRSLPLKLA